MSLNIVVFGLSITSSWGNGHATTYRGLIKALARRGHQVTFFERDVPWYADHRDEPRNAYATVVLYDSLDEAVQRFAPLAADTDLVIIGSYVPQGIALADLILARARGVSAFYDIDTPVTLTALERGTSEYLTRALIPRFDLYLSFTGGPTLTRLERQFGSPCARALYCAVDPDIHAPQAAQTRWTLGYLGTYSDDRQPALQRLLIEPAATMPSARFIVAGAQYPDAIEWHPNIERVEHLPPHEHAAFYCAQAFTLNITRADMVAAGWSPSVRLFEAAACGTPVISDRWAGLETIFTPGEELLLAATADDVLDVLQNMPASRRAEIADAARARVLRSHTADCRAAELESHYHEARAIRRARKDTRAYA